MHADGRGRTAPLMPDYKTLMLKKPFKKVNKGMMGNSNSFQKSQLPQNFFCPLSLVGPNHETGIGSRGYEQDRALPLKKIRDSFAIQNRFYKSNITLLISGENLHKLVIAAIISRFHRQRADQINTAISTFIKAFFVFTFTLGTKHSGFPYFVSLIKTTGSSQMKNDLSDDSIKFTIFFALSVRI